MRIHITGASGTGTTALAAKLARHLDYPHFDSDSYFWLPTEMPYTQKRPATERGSLLMADLCSSPCWVLSGCKCNWQESQTDNLYHLVIFLYVPHDVRLERLKKREIDRFGENALEHGGYFHENHVEFMQWASSYDTNSLSLRSKLLHENWLKSLSCPVLRLEGDHPIEDNFQSVLHFLHELHG